MPLKRHPALIPLSHDHRRGLFAANLIRTGAPRYPDFPSDLPGKRSYLLHYFESDLLHHLTKEEAILFPLAESLGGEVAALTRTLRMEHQDLRLAMQQLPEAGAPDLQEAFDHLSRLLQAHIRCEERQLFEALQAQLSEEALLDLGEKLRGEDRDLKNPPR
jgi:iron-sulfur cluster repair protein YtfE (RIC family)